MTFDLDLAYDLHFLGNWNGYDYHWIDGVGCCAACHRRDPYSFQDHCHSTGLFRGWLCHSCNTLEGFGSDFERWEAWRFTAPWLMVGRRRFYSNEGRDHRIVDQDGTVRRAFTDEQLMTTPMSALLPAVREHEQMVRLQNSFRVVGLLGL